MLTLDNLEATVRRLERQIRSLCAAQGIVPEPCSNAPTTFDDLYQWGASPILCPRTGERVGQSIKVSNENADRTVWGSAQTNAWFRAWHDFLHLEMGADFSRFGEAMVYVRGDGMIQGDAERALHWIDTEGMQCYFERWGTFPDDQLGFVETILRVGAESAIHAGAHHATH